ncbi:hypothetical protein HKX48_005537 [Thoreauomyces humboldtii]|nr:hypothetical protein HKX48_005537 [Thoreauomyces humboldtii]
MRAVIVLALVVGMLFTGTINTILNKLQDITCIANCSDPNPKHREYFEQPLWQTVNMFVGEALCLLVYYIAVTIEKRRDAQTGGGVAVVHPDDSGVADADDAMDEGSPLLSPTYARHVPQPMTGKRNLWLWLPTLCDMTATTLMNIGLIHVSASIYQMLRGSVVLFTGTLSVVFLGRRHPAYRWFALVTVFIGVAIVGLSSVVSPSSSPDDLVGADGTLTVTTAAKSDSSLLGVVLVVLAQTMTASQFVIEEKIMGHYHLPALKAVGLEGFFGLVTTSLLMPVLYFAFGRDTGNFFDLPVGFDQLVVSFPQVRNAGLGIIFSIAFFNWFGLSVTRSISATSRSTIDTCRTIFIWIISLSLGWESFRWLQVLGFVVLIYGTFLFNDVVPPPPFAFCQRPSIEEVLDEDEEMP